MIKRHGFISAMSAGSRKFSKRSVIPTMKRIAQKCGIPERVQSQQQKIHMPQKMDISSMARL